MNSIPSMTSGKVHNYLRKIGREWSGQGCAMEVGCFFGASAIPLLEGLKEAGYKDWFWGFDRWESNAQQVELAKEKGIDLELCTDVRTHFVHNVKKVYPKIQAIKGWAPGTFSLMDCEAIEICILDAPKKDPEFTSIMKHLSKRWIPGVTILGLLDYKWYKQRKKAEYKLMAPVRFMEKYGDCFELIREWHDGDCPVFFRYKKQIEFEVPAYKTKKNLTAKI